MSTTVVMNLLNSAAARQLEINTRLAELEKELKALATVRAQPTKAELMGLMRERLAELAGDTDREYVLGRIVNILLNHIGDPEVRAMVEPIAEPEDRDDDYEEDDYEEDGDEVVCSPSNEI